MSYVLSDTIFWFNKNILFGGKIQNGRRTCLLYTSDAADE